MSEKSDELKDNTKIYQCIECGLHYTDNQMAKECEDFCRDHNACSLDITKYSIESQQL